MKHKNLLSDKSKLHDIKSAGKNEIIIKKNNKK